MLDNSDYVCEQHTPTAINGVNPPTAQSPYTYTAKGNVVTTTAATIAASTSYNSVDSSFTTLSLDGSYLPNQYVFAKG